MLPAYFSIIIRWTALFIVLIAMTQNCFANDRLCGKDLPEALDLICLNGFNQKIKRAFEADDYYNDMDEELPYPYFQAPFLAKIHGGAIDNILAKTRRRRHGVYDECCKKPCTFNELKSYCL